MWIEAGAVGRLNFIKLSVRGWQDDPATWYVRQKNMTLVDHGIHYFDLIRHWAGKEPLRVAAMHASVPGQNHISPVIYSSIIDFGDNLTANHCFNNKVELQSPALFELAIDGEEGAIFCGYESARLVRKDGYVQDVEPSAKWYPYGFRGPMADLMAAIAEDREPSSSGRDNLSTLGLVLGVLESAETGRFVNLE
jgi:predicted dehydrogenase